MDRRAAREEVADERCPDRNLPDDVADRPELSGRSLRELFDMFCEMAKITHDGAFEAPDAGAA